MTVIVEQDRSLVELFQSALGGGASVLGSAEEIDRHLSDHPHEHAVVLGCSVPTKVASDFADRSRIARPTLGVILVRTRVDSSVLADALRSGMREVVEARDLTGLSDAVRRAHQLAQAMSASGGTAHQDADPDDLGTLITVFSTKGGVGKSTIATNLAAALADLGQRVCIVDLDVQSGDVAIMLQLFPTRSLADLASLRGAIDTAGVTSLLSEHSKNLSVLAAPVNVDAKEQVTPDDVSQLLEVLKALFQVVVVDTSGTFDDLTLNAFDHSDLVVLVGTLDIPALKNLKLATGTLDLLNIPRAHWRLVLNRADAKVGLSSAEFQDTLGVDIAASLPSSRDVLAAVNRGETIVRANPKLAVSQTIINFARTLVDKTGPGPTPTPAPVRGRRRRLRRVN